MLTGTEILTTAQMRAIESAAMDSGAVTGLTLMERAGAAVAGQIRLRWPKPGRATILCGPGNNGGDGYVVGRHLSRAGWKVRVLGLDNQAGPDAHHMKRRWREIGPILPLSQAELLRGPPNDIYVDAIFGTGLTRPPDGDIAAVLHHMGGSGGNGGYDRPRIVAVDCPSGLCMDSGVFLGMPRQTGEFDLHAALTVAFDSPKPGHLLARGPDCCGRLVIADIGLQHWRITKREADRNGEPRDLTRLPALIAIWPEFTVENTRRMTHADRKLARWLTKRDARVDNKFGHGHALVIAGGLGKGGAARLSARAALRIGAGLVTIAPPKSALIEHLGPPDALMRRAVDDAEDLAAALQDPRITALCLGPGCGPERARGLLSAALQAKRATVLDADALTALAGTGFDGLHDQCVLTPHGGEFARLFPDIAERLNGARRPAPMERGESDPTRFADQQRAFETGPDALATDRGPAYSKLDAARDAAARCGAVVLLKGPDTVIAEPSPRPDMRGRAMIHSAFDLPWLATAGAGDVLAGIIAGLLARGLNAFDAAGLGALLHAKAARTFGPGLIADDLPDTLPAVLRDSSQ